jgi:CarD family transcriptional regulator
MFQAGQAVVYPTHGVGRVEKIEERKILGNKKLYYLIKLDNVGMTVMIPVEHSDKARLREVSNEKSLDSVLRVLDSPTDNIRLDWKIRYSKNTEKLKEGSLKSISEVARDLYHRNQIKDLSKGEKKIYDTALQLLCDELVYTDDMDSSKAKSFIIDHLKMQIEANKASA